MLVASWTSIRKIELASQQTRYDREELTQDEEIQPRFGGTSDKDCIKQT
jgi:hypothetical protein